MNVLDKLMESARKLPEDRLVELQEAADKMLAESETVPLAPICVRCGGHSIVRNGHKHGKQAYLCRDCGKSFVETTNTVMYYSHYGKDVWEQVTKDTYERKAIDRTAKALGLDHHVVFNMRHKILKALEDTEEEEPIELGEVSELDETFVLDSYKGSETEREEAGREARKHGAKASKPGLSQEYVCICSGVERGGDSFARTVNRAVPSKEELQTAFKGHLLPRSLLLCDGQSGYKALEGLTDCRVENVNAEENQDKGFYHLNHINNFHGFIKSCCRNFRGVATKYLNRYNALFSSAYQQCEAHAHNFFEIISQCSPFQRHYSNYDVRNHNLLVLLS